MSTRKQTIHPVRWVARHPWLIVLGVALIVFAYWAVGTREVAHQVRAEFDEATLVYSGEDVQVDGLDAGKITSVKYVNGKAIVGVGIQDNQYWPLHRGTTITLRYGTTVGNGTRYLQVDPGPTSAPAIPQNGLIGLNKTVQSVEFDQVFNTFNGKTRQSFENAMQSTGTVLKNRAPQIGSAIKTTSPALGSLSNFSADLTADQQDLEGVVINGAQVTSTLAGQQQQIADLVSNAAGTFNAFSSHTTGITQSLSQLPSTLTQMKTTMAQLQTSLGHLGTFVDDVRPGATQLVTLSRRLLPAMTDLRQTIPVADETLAAGTSASPAITALLKEAQPFSATAAPALTTIAPMVACIRPYAPEIAGLMTTWTSFTKNYDGIGHVGRLTPNAGPSSVTSIPLSVAAFVKATGQGYALIRPPGFNAGQSQYDPSCDITSNGLNPADAPSGADNDTGTENNN